MGCCCGLAGFGQPGLSSPLVVSWVGGITTLFSPGGGWTGTHQAVIFAGTLPWIQGFFFLFQHAVIFSAHLGLAFFLSHLQQVSGPRALLGWPVKMEFPSPHQKPQPI